MPTKREQKATALEAKELLHESFYWSQLKWYGIKFKRNESLFWLRKKLSDAVQLGKCDTLPASLLQLEQDMRRELAPELKVLDEKMKVWNAERQAERDGPWTQRETPAEQAEEDLPRFMEHYSLTDGVPDPTKTPEILELRGYRDRSKLQEVAKRAPGLEIVHHADPNLHIIYMGWDREAVWRHAEDCSQEFRSTYIAVGEPEFGYFRGTMFLAMDDAVLAQYLEANPKDVAAVADEEEAEAEPDEATGSKRKHAPFEAESAPNKKTKGSAHRVFFRMRTSQTGTESNKGHFDFGEDLTTFTGEMEVPWVNGRVKWEGFKYSDREMPYVDTWDHYEPDAPIRRTLAFIEALKDYNVEPFS
ncbi:hypothetical protein LQW54_004822 [Pestalotiopsis sp. IQ-011]